MNWNILSISRLDYYSSISIEINYYIYSSYFGVRDLYTNSDILTTIDKVVNIASTLSLVEV